MNRSCFAVSALAMLAVAVPAVAPAQTLPQNPVGVTVRAGLFFPVDSGARQNSTVWPSIGAEVRVLHLDSPANVSNSLSVSMDWFGRSGWSQAPVLLNFVTRNGQVFFDAGAGIGFYTEPAGSGTDFAYQGGIGYNFSQTGPEIFFVEAKWRGSDRTELDGFGAYVGVHF